jgi:hypothetical protein
MSFVTSSWWVVTNFLRVPRIGKLAAYLQSPSLWVEVILTNVV